jgi:hypothetical protein
VAPFASAIVHQLEEIDAVPHNAIAEPAVHPSFRGRHRIPVHGGRALQVKLAERAEILGPLIKQVCRRHDHRRAPAAAASDAVGDRQGHERLSHADLVGEDHAWLLAESTEDFADLGSLPILVPAGDAVVVTLAEH